MSLQHDFGAILTFLAHRKSQKVGTRTQKHGHTSQVQLTHTSIHTHPHTHTHKKTLVTEIK